MSALRIFIVAGEASGDALGAALMRALRAARADIVFAGVGGEAMARIGDQRDQRGHVLRGPGARHQGLARLGGVAGIAD
ncbi:MAG: hypothetical protein N2444_08080, partial [Methylocystis sp.]|nr:hypothetical protein [Methylocystis sp.]